MTYVVTADVRISDGAPEMDALHCVGARALLDEGIESIEAIEGPDGVEVDIFDSLVAVYPGGALLKLFVDAPTLEIAEEAVGSVIEELLERSELLSDWTVEKSEVELHEELAQESLDAAEGPDAPPADPADRRAALAGAAEVTGPSEAELAAEREDMRVRFTALAADLAAFPLSAFGVADDEADDGEEDYEVGVAPEDAKVAAGALVHSTVVMVDELFQDLHVLMREETNVAETEHPMWVLDELPSRYALQYDAKFARRFLTTVLAMTTRFTDGSFQQLGCLAEELALKLLLDQTTSTLETFGLLSAGPSQALDCFAEEIYEDMDFEWLYDDSKDGIDEDEALDRFGITPLGFASWFRPFNEGRYVHPFSSDEPCRSGAS
ncbi:hypothetical protein [Streptomyces sp. ODS28]|uniref:hypothetical protein n=1 Tax=Streptomyces sp. ODS28 TaxID=3136688 RepID=UPI0031EDDC2F